MAVFFSMTNSIPGRRVVKRRRVLLAWTYLLWGLFLLVLLYCLYEAGYRWLRGRGKITFHYPVEFIDRYLGVRERHIVVTASDECRDHHSLAEIRNSGAVSLSRGPAWSEEDAPFWLVRLYAPAIRREFAKGQAYEPMLWGESHSGMLPQATCIRALRKKLAREAGVPLESLNWVGDSLKGEYSNTTDQQSVRLSVDGIPPRQCGEIIEGLRRNPAWVMYGPEGSPFNPTEPGTQVVMFYKKGLPQRDVERLAFALGRESAEMIHLRLHDST